jgi:hypothetical protein
VTSLGFGTLVGGGTVDVTGDVITVPAGLFSAATTLVVPLTSTTSIDSLRFVGVSNLSATFSVGGVTAQVPSEICPGGLAIAGGAGGVACNVGGGLGGPMGLTGTLNIDVVPGVVVLPWDLNAGLVGQGGSTNAVFLADAAAWTTGTALLNTGLSSHAYSGFTAGNTIQLVTPLFATACGNVLPLISTLSLELTEVPEPAAWLSLWLGALGLVVLTRRR